MYASFHHITLPYPICVLRLNLQPTITFQYIGTVSSVAVVKEQLMCLIVCIMFLLRFQPPLSTTKWRDHGTESTPVKFCKTIQMCPHIAVPLSHLYFDLFCKEKKKRKQIWMLYSTRPRGFNFPNMCSVSYRSGTRIRNAYYAVSTRFTWD